MNAIFYPSKRNRNVAFLCTAFFSAATIAYGSLAFVDSPADYGFRGNRSPVAMAVLGVAVFGLMLLMSLTMAAAHFVERFTIDGTAIEVRSVFQRRRFDVRDVQSLTWRVSPSGGSVVLLCAGSKSRLNLGGYDRQDRLSIIRALRAITPPDVQTGWPLFCHKIALPLRDGVPSLARAQPATPMTTTMRSRYDRLFVVALPVAVAVAVGLGLTLGLWQSLLLPFVATGFWLLLRFSVPPEGRREIRVTRTQLIALSSIPISYIVMLGLRLAGVDKSAASWTPFVIVTTAVVPMLYQLRKEEPRRRAAECEALETAPLEWDRGESPAGSSTDSAASAC